MWFFFSLLLSNVSAWSDPGKGNRLKRRSGCYIPPWFSRHICFPEWSVDSSQYYSSFSELIGDRSKCDRKYRLKVAKVIRKCKTHARENLKWMNELELELEVYEWTSSVVVIFLPTRKKCQQRSKICLKESKTLNFSFPVPFSFCTIITSATLKTSFTYTTQTPAPVKLAWSREILRETTPYPHGNFLVHRSWLGILSDAGKSSK